MINKVIKTETEYEAALNEIETLMELNPQYGTESTNRIELLSLLIQDYESKMYPMDLPDPIDAILFRMEQQDLTPRDLVPYLGSRSKVSEILARKRPLTLSMVKALHSGLGIPAKVLLQEQKNLEEQEQPAIEWARFPIKEMLRRGWIQADLTQLNRRVEEILRDFFAPLEPLLPITQATLYRRTNHIRSGRQMDDYALTAWTARVMMRAMENHPSHEYDHGAMGIDFMRQLVKLSVSDEGPLLARQFLHEHGIALIIEPHLPGTHLDGAALMVHEEMPVIGLSLRFDRLDNFWFSLMHELAHIALHFGNEITRFYDDLEVDLDVNYQEDSRERDADDLAREALIPQSAWIKSAASKLRSPNAAQSLAEKLEIHPSIVAGRMRYEFKAYRLFPNLVGYYEVRKLFPEVNWD